MKIIVLILVLWLFSHKSVLSNDQLIMNTSKGEVVIELFNNLAPNHVNRIKTLTRQGQYNGVAFHRVIAGFMAQTGDVTFGNLDKNYSYSRAGTGNSNLPNLNPEFNNTSHKRGVVSMARAASKKSANSQFFIMLADAPYLDGQYTVFGRVIKGMEFIDQVKKGSGANGNVKNPDKIISMSLIGENVANNQNDSNTQKEMMFTINDKREQCEAIGFKPETEKFADCVLRLVELDIKKQQQTQVTVAQNNGNDALVKQLERQNDIQSSKALIDLGQQLMNPKRYNSNIYMPQTQRCTVQGFGSFSSVTCR